MPSRVRIWTADNIAQLPCAVCRTGKRPQFRVVCNKCFGKVSKVAVAASGTDIEAVIEWTVKAVRAKGEKK